MNLPRDLGYILATSAIHLALACSSPLASQAEGRGFETRRPLTQIAWICTVCRLISPVSATIGLGEGQRLAVSVAVLGYAGRGRDMMATPWLHLA
jgi:hypothetical protein